jgi:hypothetical protein
MEHAVLSVLLAEGSQPVWTRDELAAQFPDYPLVFDVAFDGLRAAGVITISGEFVKIAYAVAHVNALEEI